MPPVGLVPPRPPGREHLRTARAGAPCRGARARRAVRGRRRARPDPRTPAIPGRLARRDGSSEPEHIRVAGFHRAERSASCDEFRVMSASTLRQPTQVVDRPGRGRRSRSAFHPMRCRRSAPCRRDAGGGSYAIRLMASPSPISAMRMSSALRRRAQAPRSGAALRRRAGLGYGIRFDQVDPGSLDLCSPPRLRRTASRRRARPVCAAAGSVAAPEAPAPESFVPALAARPAARARPSRRWWTGPTVH